MPKKNGILYRDFCNDNRLFVFFLFMVQEGMTGMAFDKIECGKVTVDKYFDVKYGSEKYFEYTGKEAYRALPKLLYSDYRERFMSFFETVGYEWKAIMVKMRRQDDVYRDAYIRMRKKKQTVSGEQLWDMEVYDIETLTEAYRYSGMSCNMYRTLLGFTEHSYFRYGHDTGNIEFFRINNGREQNLFSMKLEEWKKDAVPLGHVDKADQDIFLHLCEEIERGKADISADFSTSLYSMSDEIKPCHIMGSVITSDGKPAFTVGMIGLLGADTGTAASEAEEANIDHLTRLYNKKYIQNKAREIIETRSMEHFALFIMDVDNFKEVNDNFGHMYGDQVLERVAGVVSEVLADKGVAGRIGGDEFMGIIYDAEDKENVRYVLRSIRSRVQYLYADVPGVNVSCSIGASRYPLDCSSYDELFNCADKCLYIAKEKGKNRYIIYQEDLHGAIRTESKGQTEIERISSKYDANVFMVKESMEKLFRQGADAISEVLKLVVENTPFDRAAVYYGPGYKKIYSYGMEGSDEAFWADSDGYIEHFDANGVFETSYMFKVEGVNKKIFDRFKEQNTDCFIQTILGEPGNIQGYVSFECCSGEKRFQESMANGMNYLSKLIYEVLRRDERVVKKSDEQD